MFLTLVKEKRQRDKKKTTTITLGGNTFEEKKGDLTIGTKTVNETGKKLVG